MTTTRFTNTGHPQTLQAAVILLYIGALFALLSPGTTFAPPILNLTVNVLGGVGAFMLANNRKIGWYLGLLGALGPILLELFYGRELILEYSLYRHLLWYPAVIGLIFDIAIAVSLLHPMTRNYMKVWFN